MSKFEAIVDFPVRLLSSIVCAMIEICYLTIDRDFIAQHKMILFHPIKYEKELNKQVIEDAKNNSSILRWRK